MLIGRQWTCGDSYFTKHSSCSFDRAVHDPHGLLNPLHSSIRPVGQDLPAAQITSATWSKPRPKHTMEHQDARKHAKPADGQISRASTAHTDAVTFSAMSKSDMDDPHETHFVPSEFRGEHPRRAKTGEFVPGISYSDIGRFGDQTLVQEVRCTVFEVVLQSREATMCPACTRSPLRGRLPARKWHDRSTALAALTDVMATFRCARMSRTKLKSGECWGGRHVSRCRREGRAGVGRISIART